MVEAAAGERSLPHRRTARCVSAQVLHPVACVLVTGWDNPAAAVRPKPPPPPPCAHTLAITFSPRDIHSQPCLHSAPDAFGCHPTAVWNSLCHVYCIRRACSERLAGVGWDVEANAPVHGSRPPAALSVVLAVEALLQAASTVVNDGES